MSTKEKVFQEIEELANELQEMYYRQTISAHARDIIRQKIQAIRLAIIDLEHEHNMAMLETDRKYGELWT
jgi:uncharacterized protein (DUF2164 family)